MTKKMNLGQVAAVVSAAVMAFVIWTGMPSVQAETLDRIVAVVDKEPILQSEIIAEIRPALNGLQRSASSEAAFDAAAEKLMNDAVDQAIDAKILLREALIAGIKVNDEDIERRVQAERAQYPTAEAFQKEVEAAGLTLSEYRENLKKMILASRMANEKRRQFEAEVEVTESDVAQYFQDHASEFSRPERIRARQIFLSAPADAAKRAVVRARVEKLAEELKAGASFGDLAIAHSEAPGAKEGGVIGWVAKGDLVDALDDALWALPEGGVSGVVETDTGFSLLKAEKREAAGQATLDDVRKDIEPKLRETAASAKFAKWLNEQRKRSRVQKFL